MVQRYQELIAWQMADAFKVEVFQLLSNSAAASADRRYRDQLVAAAQSVTANFAEGFLRNAPGDFARFLSIGLGSLAEAEDRLRDGIRLGYFAAESCAAAFRYARRSATAAARLRKVQQTFQKQQHPSHRKPPVEPDNL